MLVPILYVQLRQELHNDLDRQAKCTSICYEYTIYQCAQLFCQNNCQFSSTISLCPLLQHLIPDNFYFMICRQFSCANLRRNIQFSIEIYQPLLCAFHIQFSTDAQIIIHCYQDNFPLPIIKPKQFYIQKQFYNPLLCLSIRKGALILP